MEIIVQSWYGNKWETHTAPKDGWTTELATDCASNAAKGGMPARVLVVTRYPAYPEKV